MASKDFVVLALPVVTGLNGLVWAETVDRAGGAIATLCGAVAYLVIAACAAFLSAPALDVSVITLVAALTALNVVTGSLWLIPLAGGTRYVSLALIEGAWPVFSILFAWLLFGRRELDLMSAIGGALILCGAALVFHKA